MKCNLVLKVLSSYVYLPFRCFNPNIAKDVSGFQKVTRRVKIFGAYSKELDAQGKVCLFFC